MTRDVVQDTAIRLFSERGYPVIGMRDLSEAVGILPGSLYAHVESKDPLLLDNVKSGVENFTGHSPPSWRRTCRQANACGWPFERTWRCWP